MSERDYNRQVVTALLVFTSVRNFLKLMLPMNTLRSNCYSTQKAGFNVCIVS